MSAAAAPLIDDAAADQAPAPPRTLPYSCQKCGTMIQLARQDPVRCPNCDHRILYKVRTIQSVVIEVD